MRPTPRLPRAGLATPRTISSTSCPAGMDRSTGPNGPPSWAAGLNEFFPHQAVAEIPTQAASVIEPMKPAWSILETLTRAVALVLQSLGQPWLIGLGATLLFIYLSCIGMGMAWYRVTFQKDSLSHA